MIVPHGKEHFLDLKAKRSLKKFKIVQDRIRTTKKSYKVFKSVNKNILKNSKSFQIKAEITWRFKDIGDARYKRRGKKKI